MRHFISVTAHELRHPIAIIKGYVQNLLELDKYQLDEDIMEILGAIELSTDRLTRLVEELLDVSRIEQGNFSVVVKEVEPHIYLHQAAEELRIRAPDCSFAFRLDEGLGKVMADPDKFVRLMIILMENALRFAPSPCTVEVESAVDGDMAVFSVYDQGDGVPEEDRERIFERFYQVEDALHHSVPGVGLGLFIAREIVEGHGGSIWHEPREGGGSVFRFTVPLA
jgi:signal transduction histidine kinase